MFDPDYLHEIVISEEKENQSILQMYITETNDLFIVTKHLDCYQVLMIDLDKSNIMEFKGDRYVGDQFKVSKKFEYTEKDVGYKKLSKLHVRGSSRKEAIDMQNKLFVFVLHEDSLYQWT